MQDERLGMRGIEEAAGGWGGTCICYSINLIKSLMNGWLTCDFISVISV